MTDTTAPADAAVGDPAITAEEVEAILRNASALPQPGFVLNQAGDTCVHVAWHEETDTTLAERRLEMAAAILEMAGLYAERSALGGSHLEVSRTNEAEITPDAALALERVVSFLTARGPRRHNTISTAGRSRYVSPKLRADDLRAIVARLEVLEELGTDRYAEMLVEQVQLRALEIRGGSVEMQLTEAREFAAIYVAAARAMLGDAENYAETKVPAVSFDRLSFDVKIAESPEMYTLVVQRTEPGKLTPHEARVRAEAERDAALAQVAELTAELAAMHDEAGHAAARVRGLEQELTAERAYITALTEPTEWGTAGVGWAAANPGEGFVMPSAEIPARTYVAENPGAVLLRSEYTAWHLAEPGEESVDEGPGESVPASETAAGAAEPVYEWATSHETSTGSTCRHGASSEQAARRQHANTSGGWWLERRIVREWERVSPGSEPEGRP